MNFRKSKNFGAIRLNISKSGPSISVGKKGLRVSLNSKGEIHRTVSIQDTGIYDRKKIGNIGTEKSNEQTSKINDVQIHNDCKQEIPNNATICTPESKSRKRKNPKIMWALYGVFIIVVFIICLILLNK